MQIDDFIDQCGAGVEYHRHQGGVATAWFQVAQVLSGHLPTFACELQQTVLVNSVFQPVWQPKFADSS
jgi:hypothetical protein